MSRKEGDERIEDERGRRGSEKGNRKSGSKERKSNQREKKGSKGKLGGGGKWRDLKREGKKEGRTGGKGGKLAKEVDGNKEGDGKCRQRD